MAYYATKKAERAACSKAWSASNKDKRRTADRKAKAKRALTSPYDISGEQMFRRLRIHNLTIDEYHAMAERQDFLCAIYKEEPQIKPRSGNLIDGFVIDHNHVTGKVRGLLCSNCNVALGMLRDNPETSRQAATYLERSV